MKKIIATILLVVSIGIGLYSKIGDLMTSIDFYNAVEPAFHDDYANATNNFANFGADLIVDATYLAVYGAIASAFVGVFLAIIAKFR